MEKLTFDRLCAYDPEVVRGNHLRVPHDLDVLQFPGISA